jgi:hypothetical protein
VLLDEHVTFGQEHRERLPEVLVAQEIGHEAVEDHIFQGHGGAWLRLLVFLKIGSSERSQQVATELA